MELPFDVRHSRAVTGISHDWAYCNSGDSRMFVADALEEAQFKSF